MKMTLDKATTAAYRSGWNGVVEFRPAPGESVVADLLAHMPAGPPPNRVSPAPVRRTKATGFVVASRPPRLTSVHIRIGTTNRRSLRAACAARQYTQALGPKDSRESAHGCPRHRPPQTVHVRPAVQASPSVNRADSVRARPSQAAEARAAPSQGPRQWT